MSLASIASNPLLQTALIVKVIRELDIDPATYMLADTMPMREVRTNVIRVDVRKGNAGMTQAAKSGAESPTVAFYGVSQFEFQPAEWREKVILTPDEIYKLRELGTYDQVEEATTIISRHLADLRNRLETRMEWMRWQCLFGTLTHTQKDIQYSVDYKIPADFRPVLTGADLWDTSTADPMDDLLGFLQKYREVAPHPKGIVMNAELEKTVMQSQKVRDLRDRMFYGQPNMGNLTRGVTQQVFQSYAGYQYQVYDGGFFEITDLLSTATASGTTLLVRSIGTIAAGDPLVIIDKGGEIVNRERLVVASVNATTQAIVVNSPGLVGTYPPGSTVRVKKFFIPKNKLVILGEMPANAEGGPQWSEIISTLHPYGPGGMMNPQAGIFARVNVFEDEDPPRLELLAGVYALPVMYHHDVNIIATVSSA